MIPFFGAFGNCSIPSLGSVNWLWLCFALMILVHSSAQLGLLLMSGCRSVKEKMGTELTKGTDISIAMLLSLCDNILFSYVRL